MIFIKLGKFQPKNPKIDQVRTCSRFFFLAGTPSWSYLLQMIVIWSSKRKRKGKGKMLTNGDSFGLQNSYSMQYSMQQQAQLALRRRWEGPWIADDVDSGANVDTDMEVAFPVPGQYTSRRRRTYGSACCLGSSSRGSPALYRTSLMMTSCQQIERRRRRQLHRIESPPCPRNGHQWWEYSGAKNWQSSHRRWSCRPENSPWRWCRG